MLRYASGFGTKMRIADNQVDEAYLRALGAQALQLLAEGEISELAERFDYALKYDLDPAVAIQQDLEECLAEIGAAGISRVPGQVLRVAYFKPNDAGLFAVVECQVLTDNDKALLVELVVTGDSEKHVTLEQISAFE